jgi:hypothetical protein
MLSHVGSDQLGFMGSSLLAPFRRERIEGLKLVPSGSVHINAALVWGACLLIFWNLARQAMPAGSWNGVRLCFYGGILPAAAVWVLVRFLQRRTRLTSPG